MERKGYEFFTEHHFVMPYNMIFRHSPEMVKSEYIYADARKGGLTPELRPLMTIIFLVVLVSLLFINLRNNRAAQKS